VLARPLAAYAERVLQRIVGTSSDSLLKVLLFGSHALGSARPESDIDVLVVVEPSRPWTYADNLHERARLLHEVGPATTRLDLVVRSWDEFAERKGVSGCVENCADRFGVAYYSREPSRDPVLRHSADHVRHGNVCVALEEACACLGRAVGERSHLFPTHPLMRQQNESLTWRAARCAIAAVLALHKIDWPAKYAPVAMWLDCLAKADALTALQMRTFFGDELTSVEAAHASLRLIVNSLHSVSPLQPRVREFSRYLGLPTDDLAVAIPPGVVMQARGAKREIKTILSGG
jgi:predicted nucleotidyltransferase